MSFFNDIRSQASHGVRNLAQRTRRYVQLGAPVSLCVLSIEYWLMSRGSMSLESSQTCCNSEDVLGTGDIDSGNSTDQDYADGAEARCQFLERVSQYQIYL